MTAAAFAPDDRILLTYAPDTNVSLTAAGRAIMEQAPMPTTATADVTAVPWFTVDKAGLSILARRNGVAMTLLELVANGWDQNVTRVDVTLTKSKDGFATFTVTDDDPDGFSDRSHAYTMYAATWKRATATVRGRFNRGEKLLLSLCKSASIATTTGTVTFDADGRHESDGHTDAGTVVTAVVELTPDDVREFARLVTRLLPPAGIVTTYNGTPLPQRTPALTFTASLDTEVADATTGEIKRRTRKTAVRLYDVREGEKASLYEMGIPVVATGDRWHVDISQKVPLNSDRDNVTPAFLRDVRTAVLNESVALITPDDTTSAWIKSGLADPNVTDGAVQRAHVLRYGEKSVIFDPSDLEANKIAASQGYTVVPPRGYSREGWANVKRAGVVLPAGKVTPSPSVSHKDGADIAPPALTDGMRAVAEYANVLAVALIGRAVPVTFATTAERSWLACYSAAAGLRFNVGALGKRWFDQGRTADVDFLLLHELGHEYGGHLDEGYHDALCRFGATLHRLNLCEPDLTDRARAASIDARDLCERVEARA